MTWVEILIAVLSGGTVGAAITGLVQIRLFNKKRKATIEDRMEAKADKTASIEKDFREFKEQEAITNKKHEEWRQHIETEQKAQSEAMKLILLDRVLHLGQSYIARGDITYEERRMFHAMHNCYHNGLHGNGDADLIVQAVDDLPLRSVVRK